MLQINMLDRYIPPTERIIKTAVVLGSVSAGMLGLSFLANPDILLKTVSKQHHMMGKWLSHLLTKSPQRDALRDIIFDIPVTDTSDIEEERSYNSITASIIDEFNIRHQGDLDDSRSVLQLQDSLMAVHEKTTHKK